MAIVEHSVIDAAGVVLTAGVETDLIGANGVDASGIDDFTIQIKNLNVSNAITAVTIYEKVGTGDWDAAGTQPTTIAASGQSIISITQHAHGFLRVTATSTAGASCDVHAHGVVKNY
jgi:hypothetical protein